MGRNEPTIFVFCFLCFNPNYERQSKSDRCVCVRCMYVYGARKSVWPEKPIKLLKAPVLYCKHFIFSFPFTQTFPNYIIDFYYHYTSVFSCNTHNSPIYGVENHKSILAFMHASYMSFILVHSNDPSICSSPRPLFNCGPLTSPLIDILLCTKYAPSKISHHLLTFFVEKIICNEINFLKSQEIICLWVCVCDRWNIKRSEIIPV